MSVDRLVLVLGREGQVATALAGAPWPAGVELLRAGRRMLDIRDRRAVWQTLAAVRPFLVVNAAAYTAVDAAELDPGAAFAVNRDGAGHVAEACRSVGARLIHLSTDYVFDGREERAYLEGDPVNPLSAYGASKAAGETRVRERHERHAILRTSWVFGPHGRNFVKTMLRLGSEQDEIAVVADQRGCPTGARAIAEAVVALARRWFEDDGPYGTFHYCGADAVSWHGFAVEIFREAARLGARTPSRLHPIASEELRLAAPRPRNSVLACGAIESAFGLPQRSWRPDLALCLDYVLGTTGWERAP